MLFGRRCITLFILTIIMISIMVFINKTMGTTKDIRLEKNEGNAMSQFIKQNNTVKLSSEDFTKLVGSISNYPNIESYIKEDYRLIEGDRLLDLSGLVQRAPQKIVTSIKLNVELGQILPFISSDGSTYKLMAIFNNNYIDAHDEHPLFQALRLVIVKVDKQDPSKYLSEIDVFVNLFLIENSNRFSRHLFIKHLYGNESLPAFLYSKGPETLGSLSALNGKRIYWIRDNVFFQLKNRSFPKEDIIKIAQWVYDNIEFTEADVNAPE